jgi:ABC-type amino acid transport substrate-binding protein
MIPHLFSLWLLLLVAAAPAEPAVLRIGMDTRTPPWSFVPGLDFSKEDLAEAPRITKAQIGALQGFDVDVMKALAQRLGVTPRVVPVSWLRQESALANGEFDALVSAWTPSPRTPPGIAASISYCDWGLLLAVRAGETEIHSPADLEGRHVGHLKDPSVAAALREMGDGKFVQAADPEKLFADLKAGVLDAVLLDSFYVRWRVARDPSFRIIGEPLNRLGYHVGVRQDDKALLERVNAAIQALLDSGEIAALRHRWEGIAPGPERR